LLAVLLASTPARAWCILGFGQCAPSIVGEYALDGKSIAKLTITADKITSSIGPVSLTAEYVIKSFNGNNVTIEVRVPEEKQMVVVIVEKDQISFIARELLVPEFWKKTRIIR
jgi:hypothetical protein